MLGAMVHLWSQSFLRNRLLLLITLLAFRTEHSSGASLFEFSDHVQEINPDSFAEITKSSVPWVLDCYSPGCPHCTRFMPTWERVGATMRHDEIRVGAVNCNKHRDLCHLFKVHGYPSLVAVNWPGAPQGTAEEPSVNLFKFGAHSFEDTMANIKTAFPGLLRAGAPSPEVEDRNLDLIMKAGKAGGEGGEGGKGGEERKWGEQGRALVAPCELRLEDAAVSVLWILRNDVFTQGLRLDDKRMGALLSFLDLLGTTFPGKMNRASFRSLAKELRSDPGLNSIARWDTRIQNLQIGSFDLTVESNWRGANMQMGTEDYVNHLTSGLWSLLHALSLSSAPRRQQPYAIMEGIHSFVENFFRCEDCRSHFLAMYEACENQRCDIPVANSLRGNQDPKGEDKLALWVWRMHNAVNARLVREGDEKTEVYKSLWPNVQECGRCWEVFPPEKDQPPWSEPDVLRFLAAAYSCPDKVGEGLDSPNLANSSWAVKCVAACAVVSLLMWARRRIVMRGVGLSKKRVDAGV